LDFGSSSPAKDQRDKNAGPRFNPPRLMAGSSTRILKYVEDLKHGPNKEIGTKGFFEIASNYFVSQALASWPVI
jgi:hypothetical protein